MTISIAAIVGIVVLCLIGLRIAISGTPQNQTEQIVRPAFHRIYGALPSCPALKVSSSYGYPAFEIVFASKADFERAADQNSEFKREIEGLFARYGAVDRPFDPELATFFNYPGRIQEMVAGSKVDSPRVDTRRSVI